MREGLPFGEWGKGNGRGLLLYLFWQFAAAERRAMFTLTAERRRGGALFLLLLCSRRPKPVSVFLLEEELGLPCLVLRPAVDSMFPGPILIPVTTFTYSRHQTMSLSTVSYSPQTPPPILTHKHHQGTLIPITQHHQPPPPI